MAKPVLYSYFRSTASWRVRIALAYKGIDYDYKAVNTVKGHQKNDDYLAVNPMGQVPSLSIDGVTLTQSLPIIEYLEETRPDRPLLPKDPVKKARARQLAEVINSGIQPMQSLAVLNKVGELTEEKGQKMKWANHWITQGFQALEAMLASTSGKFCVGDEISLADIHLVPQVFNAHRFGVDMSQFPVISRINEECMKHEAFQAADPMNQPDCPEEVKKAS